MSYLKTLAKIYKWHCINWLPKYIVQQNKRRNVYIRNQISDIIFTVVDHFEPSKRDGEKGIEDVRTWCKKYADTAGLHTDSDGVHPLHTWFYRYDYPSPECVNILSEYVYKGFGEIEFHLHHGNDTSESFRKQIEDGLEWFNQFGAMISADPGLNKRFAYIAGNWALDNGAGDDALSGVNNEIEILANLGCYADFTFPAFGSPAQPRKVNSIYYATDTPEPKSYDTGVDLKAGMKDMGDLVIFQGPLYIDWENAFFDYASFEHFTPFFEKRIEYWINSGIHVENRPEWLFIKLHTHGMQSRDVFLGQQLDSLHSNIEKYCSQEDIRLHYASAREAYNIAIAAVANETDNPDNYRNYLVKEPANTKILTNMQYQLKKYTQDEILIATENKIYDEKAYFQFKNLPITKIECDEITEININYKGMEILKLDVSGKGSCSMEYRDGTTKKLSL